MKKFLSAVLAAVLVLSLAACGSSSQSSSSSSAAATSDGSASSETAKVEPMTVRISAGPSGGNNFMICATFADLIMKAFPEYTVSAEISNGTAQNIRATVENEAQMCISMSDGAMYANEAGREYTDLEPGQFAYVAGGYQTIIHFMVPADSTVESVYDLKGAKIAASQGTTCQYYLPIVLEAYGMTVDDVEVSQLQLSDMMNAVNDGTVDAAFHITSYPLAAISDVAATTGIKILNIDGDEAAYIHENYPFFSSMVITGGSYQGVDEDVQTVGTLNTLICRTDLDETFVYNFVKTIMESTDTLSSVYPLCGNFNLENTLEGAVIPIHPGAEKYYKEAGIL